MSAEYGGSSGGGTGPHCDPHLLPPTRPQVVFAWAGTQLQTVAIARPSSGRTFHVPQVRRCVPQRAPAPVSFVRDPARESVPKARRCACAHPVVRGAELCSSGTPAPNVR